MGRDYDITKLLISKQFSDLDKDEKAYILSLVDGEGEYNELRHIALQARDQEQEASEARESVMAAFDREFTPESHSKKSGIRKYWPYFAAAASLVVLLILGNMFLTNEQSQLAETKPSGNEEKVLRDSASSAMEKTADSAETKIENTMNADQIAELKPRTNEKVVEDSEVSEMIVEDDTEELIQPEIDNVVDDSDEEGELVVAAEQKEDQSTIQFSLKPDQEVNREELADQPSVVSAESANLRRSNQITQSSANIESIQKEKSKFANSDLFQIKRFMTDHYTAY